MSPPPPIADAINCAGAAGKHDEPVARPRRGWPAGPDVGALSCWGGEGVDKVEDRSIHVIRRSRWDYGLGGGPCHLLRPALRSNRHGTALQLRCNCAHLISVRASILLK